MKVSDATKDLMVMDEKRAALLDNCTRALCGDNTVDAALLDEATGGRYSTMAEQDDVDEQIKTLLLALRWLALPPEKKTRKRRSTKSAKSAGAPAKKRGRPRGSKNKAKDNGADTETGAAPPPQTTETGVSDQPSA
jgi:hypothetical protein